MQCTHNSQDLRSDNRIMDSRALATRLDQPIRPQPHELLRHRYLVDIELLTQLGNRLLAIYQSAQHQEALRVRQAAHQLGGRTSSRDHV